MTWTLDHLRAALAGGPAFLGVVADATLKVTALLLAAALATLLVRRAPAAARHFVWSLAAAGALAIPVLSALLPSWRVPLLPPARPSEVVEVSRRVEAPAPLPRPALIELEPSPLLGKRARTAPTRYALLQERAPVAYLAVVEERLPVPAREEAPRFTLPDLSVGQVLGVLWALGCALALLRIVAGRIGVRLLASRAVPVVEPGPLEVLDRLRRRMGIRRRVTLLQADRATLPMTWGSLRPVVLLPADAHTWTLDRLELVLLHELAHVRRLDALTQLVAQLACAVYWFHPLVWLAARRMRVLREYACDDHVLNAGTRASAYAGEILEIVRSLRSDPLAPASATLAMARRSQIEGRLLAILDPGLRRRAFGSRTAKAIGAVGLMVLMPLAALQPTAAAQPQEEAPRGPLPRLSPKESERRKSTTVQDATVAPVSPGTAAPAVNPAPAPVPAGSPAPVAKPTPAQAPAPAVAPVPPVPPAPPEPPAVAGLPVPPAPPAPPSPPAPPASDPYRLGCLSRAGEPNRWTAAANGDRFASKASIDGGRCRIKVSASGRLSFTPNLSDLEALAPGASFLAEEKNGELTRSIEIRADQAGTVTRTWKVNGQLRPVDAEAKMFLAALLAQLDRASGFPSSQRASDEDDDDRDEPELAGPEARAAMERAAGAAKNDEELVRALERFGHEETLEDARARRAYLAAADRIRGAEPRARALRVLLNRAPIDAETARAVMASAGRIDQEEPLLAVLLTLLRMEESELVQGPLVTEYLKLAERLRSEEKLAKVLASLLHPEPVAQEGVLRALELASAKLQSDELKHRVLVEVIDHQELDPKVKARAQQLISALRDQRLQAESLKRLEKAGDGHRERRSAVNVHVGRAPFRVEVDVDHEGLRREAEQVAREAARASREAARDAKRLAEDAARQEAVREREHERARKQADEDAARREVERERVRERARQQAEEARRRWSAESERLRAEAERLRQQARQLNEQVRERARKLKEKLSKELTEDELESLNLDDMDELEFDL